MAERDSKSEPRATEVKEPQRHYTVGYAPNGGKKPPSPQLKLSGRWLENSALTPDSRLSSPLSGASW